MAINKKVLQAVGHKLVQLVMEDNAPWQRPWDGGFDMPVNAWGKPYGGINIWTLLVKAYEEGFNSRVWLTIGTVKKRGGLVNKEELKNWTAVLWFRPRFKKVENEDGEIEEQLVHWSSGYWRVYNGDQTNLTPEQLGEPEKKAEFKGAQVRENLEELLDLVPVEHEGSKAYYTPRLDTITLPPMESFRDTDYYYAVKAHETVHATGHPTRLGRMNLDKSLPAFGSKDYSSEELVAESGAALIAGMFGFKNELQKNAAAYLRSWLEGQDNKEQALVSGLRDGYKAVEFLMERMEEDEPERELVPA